MDTFCHLRTSIQNDYKSLKSWRLVGLRYGINKGIAWSIAHGKEPHSPHVRHVLGLPALVEIPPCKTCGGNHGMKRCPTTNKPRARRAISLTDPVSAATTIIRHMSRENIERLRELLEIP